MPNMFEHCEQHADIANSHNLAKCVSNKTHGNIDMSPNEWKDLRESIEKGSGQDINVNIVKVNFCKHIAMGTEGDARDERYEHCMEQLGVRERERHPLKDWEQFGHSGSKMTGNPYAVKTTENMKQHMKLMEETLHKSNKSDHEKVEKAKKLHEEHRKKMAHHYHHREGIGEHNAEQIRHLEEGQHKIEESLNHIEKMLDEKTEEKGKEKEDVVLKTSHLDNGSATCEEFCTNTGSRYAKEWGKKYAGCVDGYKMKKGAPTTDYKEKGERVGCRVKTPGHDLACICKQ